MAAGGIVSGPAVLNVPPALDEWGMVVRVLGGGAAPVIVDLQTFGTAVVTSVPQAIVVATLLAANVNRKAALFYNSAPTQFLYLKYGVAASSVLFTVRIGPGGFHEISQAIYNGVITGVWNAVGAGACLVTEVTPP